MADFLTNLWESVFTPGTTPTLLIATNVTFAALQLVLLGLLIATYSIHFAILSVLCGGLWYSINWFAAELAVAQRAEDEAERLRKRKAVAEEGRRGEVGDADDEGEDTEVEVVASLRERQWSRETKERAAEQGSGVASGTQSGGAGREMRQRPARTGELSSSEMSTDSEWEQVSEGGR